MHQYFVEVILPLSLQGTFTYHFNKEQKGELSIGQRIAVPFGSRKIYTGIVYSIHQQKPVLYKTKPIYAILDQSPLVLKEQINFWEWIAYYYMCTLGDIYRNVFPSALKLESETFVKLNNTIVDKSQLNKNELIIVENLNNKGLIAVSEMVNIIDQKLVLTTLKALWEKNIILLDEKLQEKYTPKIERYIQVPSKLLNNQIEFNKAINSLKNAPKQRELFLQLIVQQTQSNKPIKSSFFIKQNNTSNSILKSLKDKSLIEIYLKNTSRVKDNDLLTSKPYKLSSQQSQVLKEIEEGFNDNKPVLLHGVTSSGKTEIYIQLIQKQLSQQKKVLFLLPEIGLTTQILQRVKKHFGGKVGVYHSKFSQNERVELWQKTLNNEYQVIIGVRSALFLPLQNIGLIIVDEEHDSTYKQTDNKPYYQARDMAMVLANKHNSNVLLGSSTPSLESFYNATTEKYKYIYLGKRYNANPLPIINLIDLKKAYTKKEITENISHVLRDEIQESLNNKKQVIIFQNRRGYAPILSCESCGHTPCCANCDVSLTYHKTSNHLKCHYCGYTQAMPKFCIACSSPKLQTKGIGTEQIELELKSMFPTTKIARMDVDTMRKKFAYEKLIEKFEEKEIDILVGTQMITKGLDFANVNLVGVIRADSLFSFPNFRAHEKAFQLLTQVAGRAGRREEQGKVLIQTFNPDHQILQQVTTYDYLKMANEVLYERKNFLYPPYYKIIQITFKHANKERVNKTAHQFVMLIKPHLPTNQLLGPESPPIGRIRNQYIINVLIKIAPNQSHKRIKKFILKQLQTLNTVSVYRSVQTTINVDP